MSDLIARLREGVVHYDSRDDEVMAQAAEQIERLRGLLREARRSVTFVVGGHALLARIDAALDTAVQSTGVQQ